MSAASADELRPGEVLSGRYRIEALLGEGGYGRVFRATQVPLGREVAVKVVLDADPELCARIAREADVLRRLEHPHTVRLLDHGETPAGLPFLVFELLRGEALFERLARGPLPLPTSLELTAQLLRALSEAHALGIVHRDIKPENVFLTSHAGQPEFVKLLDFGIARETTGSRPKLTAMGQTVGTPSYMAPEQTLGLPLDARTDLYAVGLLLAEMVTGRTVVAEGGLITIMTAQARDAPLELDPALRRGPAGPIVERAVQKDPALRFGSAAEMLAAIEAASAELARAGASPTWLGEPPPAAPVAHLQPLRSQPGGPTLGVPTTSAASSHAPRPAPLPFASAPVMQGPHGGDPAPLPLGAAPQRPSRSRRAISCLGPVGLLAVALSVVAFAAVRGLGERAWGGPGGPARPIAAEDGVREARSASPVALRALLTAAGYRLLVDHGQQGSHTFVVRRGPCTGSVSLATMPSAEAARASAARLASMRLPMVALVAGETYVTIGLVREGTGAAGIDGACSEEVALVLAR